MYRLLMGLLPLMSLFWAGQSLACSKTTPCEVDGGAYFVALPENADGPVPAVFFIHGFGGSGDGALRVSGMLTTFLDRGYAVIAPNGMPRGNGRGLSWSFHPDREGARDEIAFINVVRENATERFNLDPDRLILSGFSIGGSMTSYLACAKPESFTAYAPLGGNFWRPHPENCAGPVRLLHTHGWTDGTVPLEGRVVRGTDIDDPNAFTQGDVFHAMNIWRQTNGCSHLKADKFETKGPFWRRSWERCDDGTALELALFPGGHVIPSGWAELTLDWFENF